MEHIAQGKRSDTLGPPHSRVYAPCKGKSFNPLCFYSYLITDLTVLKWNIVCIFCSTPAPCLKAFALTGRDCSNTRYPGCRFACPGLWAPLGFQPVLAKSETWVSMLHATCYVKVGMVSNMNYLVHLLVTRWLVNLFANSVNALWLGKDT